MEMSHFYKPNLLQKQPASFSLFIMNRHSFKHDDLTLSYLDQGGAGDILIALHAHWMEAGGFEPLAEALALKWRVIALDQRGHGYSSHAKTYTRDDYLRDLEAFFKHLKIDKPLVILGNSLGGINAYQFAARHPELVRALIIEDIDVEVDVDVAFSLAWAGTFPTKEALIERIGPRFLPYLEPSFRETSDGWRLAFDPKELNESCRLTAGSHWEDWLASDCPALVIGGTNSRITSSQGLKEMANKRPRTQLKMIEGGHVLHVENPDAFNAAVKAFLSRL